jgi:hypothetical protein
VPELDTDCELVWAKMNLKGNGNIYICAYYRRNVTDEESIRNFETIVEVITDDAMPTNVKF